MKSYRMKLVFLATLLLCCFFSALCMGRIEQIILPVKNHDTKEGKEIMRQSRFQP